MSEKTILITGATSGIGTETAIQLASQGHTIYMLVRNKRKGDDLRQRIIAETKNKNIYVIECDLASLESVKKAAQDVIAKVDAIHVLINNAGGMFPTRQLTKDGFEMTFGVNHLGHFLLTLSLIPLLEKGTARVINVSSAAHWMASVNFNDLQMEKSYSAFRAYANAKLFNIYFTKSLAERYAGKNITSYCLHPGVVKTNFGGNFSGLSGLLIRLSQIFAISPAKGAITSVYLATQPAIETLRGKYFINVYWANSSKASNDNDSRHKLWNMSYEMVKPFLDESSKPY